MLEIPSKGGKGNTKLSYKHREFEAATKTYIYAKQLQFFQRCSSPEPLKQCENDGDKSNPNEGLYTEAAEEILIFKKLSTIRKKGNQTQLR